MNGLDTVAQGHARPNAGGGPPDGASASSLTLPTPTSAGARILRGLVRFYRLFFSAWLGAGCRYVPSCSQYAIGALERHGALGGSYLALWRVLRCHPGCTGGRDDVPDHLSRPRLFAFLGPSPRGADPRLPGPGPMSNASPAPGHTSPETTP